MAAMKIERFRTNTKGLIKLLDFINSDANHGAAPSKDRGSDTPFFHYTVNKIQTENSGLSFAYNLHYYVELDGSNYLSKKTYKALTDLLTEIYC